MCPFIDDSTDQVYEEEEFYQEEEEENFNHCTTQGKPSTSSKLSKLTLASFLTMQDNRCKMH